VRRIDVAEHWPLLAVALLLALVIIVRHRENIRRLLSGRELAVTGNEARVQVPPKQIQ
jgi:glycerol-3-phosphate acyltransferase PlsY